MTHTCPLCGSKAILPQVAIILGQNRIVVDNSVIKLKPRLTEVAHVLWDNYPNYVDSAHIFATVYGDKSRWPMEVTGRRQVHELRAALSNTRLQIENCSGLGWRFKINEHNEDGV